MLPLKLNAKVSTVRIVDIFFGKYFFFIVVLCLYVVWVFLFVCVCNLVLCSWQEPRFIEKISSVQLQHIITALLFQIWLMQLYGKPHKTAVAKATLDLTLILYYFASGKEWSKGKSDPLRILLLKSNSTIFTMHRSSSGHNNSASS